MNQKDWLGLPGGCPERQEAGGRGGSWGTSEGAGPQGWVARPQAESQQGSTVRAWEPTGPSQRQGGSKACTRQNLGAEAIRGLD